MWAGLGSRSGPSESEEMLASPAASGDLHRPMKLEADARIAFPRQTVYAAYRDRLPEMVPFLPDIRAIRVESRDEYPDAGRVELVNVWEASADIPKILSPFVKPDMLAWVDRATWEAATWSCDWRIEPRVFTQNVQCWGRNTYREDGEGTVLEIRGQLEVDPSGIPGVPKMLAGKVAPSVEKFVVNLIRPNLISVAEGLERFLNSER